MRKFIYVLLFMVLSVSLFAQPTTSTLIRRAELGDSTAALRTFINLLGPTDSTTFRAYSNSLYLYKTDTTSTLAMQWELDGKLSDSTYIAYRYKDNNFAVGQTINGNTYIGTQPDSILYYDYHYLETPTTLNMTFAVFDTTAPNNQLKGGINSIMEPQWFPTGTIKSAYYADMGGNLVNDFDGYYYGYNAGIHIKNTTGVLKSFSRLYGYIFDADLAAAHYIDIDSLAGYVSWIPGSWSDSHVGQGFGFKTWWTFEDGSASNWTDAKIDSLYGYYSQNKPVSLSDDQFFHFYGGTGGSSEFNHRLQQSFADLGHSVTYVKGADFETTSTETEASTLSRLWGLQGSITLGNSSYGYSSSTNHLLPTLIGIEGTVNLNGSGTIDRTSAVAGTINNNSTNTITNASIFRAIAPNNPSGTITTLIGLKIDSLTQGGTNYAIYTEGTAQSRFGGSVKIGSNSVTIDSVVVNGDSVRTYYNSTGKWKADYIHNSFDNILWSLLFLGVLITILIRKRYEKV